MLKVTACHAQQHFGLITSVFALQKASLSDNVLALRMCL